MSRVKMDWDWVKGYPIFVYTVWISPNKFDVKLVKGMKGNQNAPGFGPKAPAWHQYTQSGYSSKDEVVKQAFKMARGFLKQEGVR